MAGIAADDYPYLDLHGSGNGFFSHGSLAEPGLLDYQWFNFVSIMRFGRRKDGRFYPKDNSRMQGATDHVSGKTYGQVHPQKRVITRKERARLSTLENPLLWSNFVKKLGKLNPDFDFEQLVDRTLEPEEAMMDMKKKYPHLDIGLREQDKSAGFREFLDDFGISNTKVQNMIAMDPNPFSEQELAQLSYLLNNRPEHSQQVDKALKAPIARDIRQWINHPNRVDIKTVDQ